MFTVLYYVVIFTVVIIFLIATVLVWPLTVPFDPTRRAVHAISRGISMVFLRTPPCWKTRVEGLENIDREQTYVIVLNHRTMVDILMLYWTPMNFRWVSKSKIKKLPLVGQYLMLHGDILIPEGAGREAAKMIMDKGRMWLVERKVCVAIFPEGTRSRTGEIGRFKPTAFALAKEAGVAVLPVVLDGSNVVGRGGRLPWKHNFTVKVLPPVSAAEVAKKDPREVMEETHKRMVEAKLCLK